MAKLGKCIGLSASRSAVIAQGNMPSDVEWRMYYSSQVGYPEKIVGIVPFF